MKTKIIRNTMVMVCLTTVVATVVVTTFAPRWFHREWKRSVANTKTVVAAVRYLVEPDFRYFPQHPAQREFASPSTELLLTIATNQSSAHNSNQTTSASQAAPVSG